MKQLLTFALLLISLFAGAVTNSAYNAEQLHGFWQNGQTEQLQRAIKSCIDDKPTKAWASYYQACLQIDENQFISELKKVAALSYEQVSQKANLELAKLAFLDRDYPTTKSYLNKAGNSAKVVLLKARTALAMHNYKQAITYAQQALTQKLNVLDEEFAQVLVAQALYMQKNYKAAAAKYDFIKRSYSSHYMPLVVYQLGCCQESAGDFDNAVTNWRLLLKTFPYSQYSFLAEDRLYSLKLETTTEISWPDSLAKQLNHTAALTDFTQTFSTPGKTAASLDLPDVKPLVLPNSATSSQPILTTLGSNPLTPPAATNHTQVATNLRYYLQVGAFADDHNAQGMEQTLKRLGYSTIVYTKVRSGQMLKVVAAGPFSQSTLAEQAQQKLQDNDISSFVIKRH